jgi:hypothetical protein
MLYNLSVVRFTTETEDEIDADLRSEGVDRIEVIEGLYGGRLLIQAIRTNGEWGMVADWNDGITNEVVLWDPLPGIH